MLDPDVAYRLEIFRPNREVTTLITRVDALKSEVECLGGRQGALIAQNNLWIRIIIIVYHNPLTTECSDVVFGDSDTATDRSKDRQGNLFILLVSETVYFFLWWHKFRIYYLCGFQ